MIKNTKEIIVREGTGEYIYDQRPIVRVRSSLKTNLNILYAILIVILAAFGIVGQDLATLTGYIIIALAGGIPAFLFIRNDRSKFWVGALLGCFIVAVIIATDMNERAFENAYMIAAALQHISWVGIGTIVALWAIGRKIVP